jgi:hypothetical protein
MHRIALNTVNAGLNNGGGDGDDGDYDNSKEIGEGTEDRKGGRRERGEGGKGKGGRKHLL